MLGLAKVTVTIWDEVDAVDRTVGAELVDAAGCVVEELKITAEVKVVDDMGVTLEGMVEAVPLSLEATFPLLSKKVPRLLAQHAGSLLQQ